MGAHSESCTFSASNHLDDLPGVSAKPHASQIFCSTPISGVPKRSLEPPCPQTGSAAYNPADREIEQGEDLARVLVSHSSKDAYFGSLLVELLRFHDIDTWCSSSSIQAGIVSR